MTTFNPAHLNNTNYFFHSPSYLHDMRDEFNSDSATCAYECLGTKPVFSSRNSLYHFFQKCIIPLVLPAVYVSKPKNLGDQLSQVSDFKYKRIFLLKNGMKIDGVLMGTESSLKSKRWTIASLGNMDTYERAIFSPELQNLLMSTGSNALFFNYPGVGASQGKPCSKSASKAYRAALDFLLDDQGAGAKEVIGYGFSIGGGVQGEALNKYPLQKHLDRGVRFIFIKDRTFSSLEKVACSFTGFLGRFLKYLGWSLECVSSSKKLSSLGIPEIIIQAGDQDNQPISDGVISAEASLHRALQPLTLSEKSYIHLKNKHPSAIHNSEFDMSYLGSQVNKRLKEVKLVTDSSL